MKWYYDLYLGENANTKKRRLIRMIEFGKTPKSIYLITLAAGMDNQLEILPVTDLKNWYKKDRCPMIVGLADGKKEALGVVERIVQDVYKATGGVQIKQYFQEKVTAKH